MTVAAGARVLEIERSLGDPWDAANAASLVCLADGCRADDAVLDRLDLDADFVPVSVGGRLRRLDQLGRLSRHVLGRDADLALSAGMNSLPASASLWVSGTLDQQRRAAETLLRRHPIRYVGLGTGKSDVDTADDLVVIHADGPDSTLLLLDGAHGDSPIGGWGHGLDVEGRRQALTTSVSASALIGLGDTALRLGVRAFGGADDTAPRWLGDCFADLLVADAVATVACRSVHLLPAQCEVLAAAARWQAAQLIGEILYRVALHDPLVPSATAAPLAKLVHDFTTMTRRLPWVEPAHLVIGRRLPQLVTAPIGSERPAAFDRLYDLVGDLPELGPARVEAETEAGWLHLAAADDLALHAATEHRAVLHEQYRILAAEAQLQRAAARDTALTYRMSNGTGTANGEHLIDPARHYALLLAATVSIRVWAAADHDVPPEAVHVTDVTDEAWLLVGLDRLLHRLGLDGPAVPAAVHDRLTAEAMRRIREPRSLDLFADRMSG